MSTREAREETKEILREEKMLDGKKKRLIKKEVETWGRTGREG